MNKIKKMEIGNYIVKCEPHGWRFAIACVYIKGGGFLGLFDKFVWEGPTRFIVEAEKMYPDKMKEWFTAAIEEYENYKTAWEKI